MYRNHLHTSLGSLIVADTLISFSHTCRFEWFFRFVWRKVTLMRRKLVNSTCL